MVMVPQDPFRQHEVGAPVLNQLLSLDNEMQSILSNQTIPDEMKLQRYMQILQRYQLMKGQQQPQQPQQSKFPQLNYDAVPRSARNKVKMLLHHLESNQDKIQWTSDGKLKVHDMPIENSNFSDLIHSATRQVPRGLNIPGAAEFSQLLSDTNAPQLSKRNDVSKTFTSALAELPFSPIRNTSTPKRKQPSLALESPGTPLSQPQLNLLETMQENPGASKPAPRRGSRDRKTTVKFGNQVGNGWDAY